jgi:3-isopropylmalate/(R)-2-methylmalate dehydratase small subunit
LLVRLDKDIVADITKTVENADTAEMTVDLENCKITYGGKTVDFTVDGFRRECLLKGLDDIGLTLENAPDIESYETMLASERPWIAA